MQLPQCQQSGKTLNGQSSGCTTETASRSAWLRSQQSWGSLQWLFLRYILVQETWAHARARFSNELISRDEGLHAEFACLLYGMLENKLPDDVVHDIIRGATAVERKFICEALS